MISELGEPLGPSETDNDGSAGTSTESSSSIKMPRPYAGADGSMDDIASGPGSSQSSSKVPKPELLVGDLVWSKIPGHAWWPSMVSYEPNKAVYFQSSGRGKTCFKYHVQFFGDEPQRGWVSDKNMIRFTGKDPLMELPTSVVPKRDKFTHSKQAKAWERALEQAQKAFPLNRQQRKLCYVFKYNDDHLSQKMSKSSKSPDSPTKKKEKLLKKSGKVKTRVTRRSCLLDKPDEFQDDTIGGSFDSFFTKSTDNEDTLDAAGAYDSSETENVSLKQSHDKKGNSVGTVGIVNKTSWKRRGRSARVFPGLLIDAVHDGLSSAPEDLEDAGPVMTVNEPHLGLPRLDVKEAILTDEKLEKFKVSRLNSALKDEEMANPNKRYRDFEKDDLLKRAKKIKLGFVASKAPYFEIVPKKILKNKQTQTPERKKKTGNAGAREKGRKTACIRKKIKTKETHASKKFSRRLKLPATKADAMKKLSRTKSQKEISKNVECTYSKVDEKEAKEGVGRSESAPVEDAGETELEVDEGGSEKDCETVETTLGLEFSSPDNEKTSIKASKVKRKGRGRKKRAKRQGCISKPIAEDSETPITNVTLNYNDSRTVPDSAKSPLEESIRQEDVSETFLGHFNAGTCAGAQSENDKTSSSRQRSTVRKKVKNASMPSRRSTRNHVMESGEKQEYLICKARQVLEIDDILSKSTAMQPRGKNGVNGCIPKESIFELLRNFEQQIPIEVERSGTDALEAQKAEVLVPDRKEEGLHGDSIDKTNESIRTEESAEAKSNLDENFEPVTFENSAYLGGTSPSDDKMSCQSEEQLKERELTLYNKPGDDYLQIRSDEKLSTCTMISSCPKDAGFQDDFNLKWQERGKEQAKGPHSDQISTDDKEVGLNISFSESTMEPEIRSMEMKLMNSHAVEEKNLKDIVSTSLTDDDSRASDVSIVMPDDASSNSSFIAGNEGESEVNIENNTAVFETEGLDMVDETDVYLNADDVGLPVSRDNDQMADGNRLTVCVKAGDSGERPSKEIESFNHLGKLPGLEQDFDKSTHLDMHRLVDFQPVFSRRNLPFGPVFACSQSCHEKGFDSTCNVMTSLSTQMTLGEGYPVASKAVLNNHAFNVISSSDLAHSNSLGEMPASNDIYVDSNILSLVDTKKSDLYGIVEYRKSKVDNGFGLSEEDGVAIDRRANESTEEEGEEANSVTSCRSFDLENPEDFNLVVGKRDVEENSSQLPGCTDCNRPLHGDDQGAAEDDGDQCSALNMFHAYENAENGTGFVRDREEGLVPGIEEGASCTAGEHNEIASEMLDVPDCTYMARNVKTPTKTGEEELDLSGCLNRSPSKACGEVKSSPNALSDGSSPDHQNIIGQRQSILSSGDSVKSGEGASLSCCKRQRKRKSMSDFHVGLAFDEILSSRGRASEAEKGKPALGKKKRDSARKIDFEPSSVLKSKVAAMEEETLDSDGKANISLDGAKKVSRKSRTPDVSRQPTQKKSAIASEQKSGLSDPQEGSGERNEDEVNELAAEKTSDSAGDCGTFRIDEQSCSGEGLTLDSVTTVNELPEKPKVGRRKTLKVDGRKSKAKKGERKVTPKKSSLNSVLKKAPKKDPKDQRKGRKSANKAGDDIEIAPEDIAAEVKLREDLPAPKEDIQRDLVASSIAFSNEKKPKRKYVRKKNLNKMEDLKNIPAEVINTEKDVETSKSPRKRGPKKSAHGANGASHTKPERTSQKRKKELEIVADEVVAVDDVEKPKRGRKAKKRKRIPSESRIEPHDFSDSSVMGPPPKRAKHKRGLNKQNRGRRRKDSDQLPHADEEDSNSSVFTNKSITDSPSLNDKDALVENLNRKGNTNLNSGYEEEAEKSSIAVSVVDSSEGSLLSAAPGKKTRKGEKFETRSNVSDETSSVSGKECDEAGKGKRDSICVICEQSEGLLSCNGVCYGSFHPDCLGLSTVPEKFFCDECLTGNHSCFLCKETGNLRKCSFLTCGKFYHQECAEKTPGCRVENSKLFCSLHGCGTCANDKDSNVASKKRMLRCVRCPTAYHASGCLVAGCMQLTSSLMVCNKHFLPNKSKPHHTHYNVSWCFVCSTGGMLVCCDTCPAAFHPGCVEDLNGVPDEGWQCDSCREGKKPLFGDLVWVKYGFWRWWPARICFPDEIPPRIQNLPHDVGEFPVMFFGSRDYCWLHAGRVFPYQEGDKGCKGSNKSGTNKIFEKAIREVEEAHKELKEIHDKQMEQKLAKQSKKPPPYKHIKTNKYVSAVRSVLDPSEFTLCECLPRADNPCGPGSECLNRMLQIECNKTCEANEKCQNQRFQKCEQVDCVPFKTTRCGWGLKTRQDIKKGDFVIEYVGELIDEATCRKRINDYHDKGIIDYYFLVIDKDNIIDAYPKGNASRFMNHCCDPNCDTQKWTVNGEIRVGLFANQDIKAGSELMFNYNLDTLGNEKKACQCGSKNCSGFLGVRPKTQSALALGEKKKKDKQKKKRKSKKDKTKVIRHEDECFACGDGGELIMCDRLSCSKCYHLKCLTLSDMPKGKWDCPWHFCDICGKRASYYCSICPNSFCGSHREGEIFEVLEGVFICDEHSDDEINAEKNKVLLSKEKIEKVTGQKDTGQQEQGPKDRGRKDKSHKDKGRSQPTSSAVTHDSPSSEDKS